MINQDRGILSLTILDQGGGITPLNKYSGSRWGNIIFIYSGSRWGNIIFKYSGSRWGNNTFKYSGSRWGNIPQRLLNAVS